MVLEFLNRNNGAFSVIFSAFVAIATMVYAVLTWRLVSETRKMRESQTEPNISITIQPREEWISLIDMIIQNIGSGPAYNVKFEINPDFEYAKGKMLSELSLIKKGLEYFAPNQKYRFFLTSMVENYEEKIKNPFEVKVTYENIVGKTYEGKYLVNFSTLVGLRQLGEPSLYKISKNIERIQRDINHLSTGFSRMEVVVYTKKDIEEETKLLLEQANQLRNEDKKEK